MKTQLLIIASLLLMFSQLDAQVYSNKVVGEKNEALKDSLKVKEYPYLLPIWGKKVTAKGFDLPYSAGIGVNYMWQESELIIDNIMVGFNNGPMYNVDELVHIDNAIASMNAINVRPDIWLFPFLNVYGIFVKAQTSTAIDASVNVKDENGVSQQLMTFSTKAEFDATTAGFGFTPTVGVAGGWLALDMNCAWTDVSALDKPVFTFVFGPRLGKTFKFKKPERNIAFWAGGFRVKFTSETSGSINLNEIVNTDEIQTKVDEGLVKVEQTQVKVDDWWNSLSSAEQKNPVNEAKYDAANRTIEAGAELLNSMDSALNDDQYSSVQYSLDKDLKDKWNFVLGTQFQLNKHFMIRGEYGFLGTRQQFITGLQYRFGL